jgi:hypothetical protein
MVVSVARFKQPTEAQGGRRASPLPDGGDSKSKAFKNKRF